MASIHYKNNSCSGNKYAGYRHICRRKTHRRTICSQSATVPASLQHQFTYQLATAGWDNTPILTYTEKLSKLVGKRLTLSYIPASQADADLIASYLPKPHADGSPILPSELPTSLPGYLINLKAQINLDGVAVATSSTALPMGTDLQSTGGFSKLSDPTQWDLTSETSNVVGQAKHASDPYGQHYKNF